MGEIAVKTISFEPGFIIITDTAGQRARHPVADVLRALDIPVGLTYSQVSSVTALANLCAILIRTLIDREVLDESFLEDGDINLDDIVESIENMGGDYGDTDLSGSET